MPRLDLIIVGLCALVTEGEADCKTKVTPADYETEPFDIVLADDGSHEARFYLDASGIKKLGCEIGGEDKTGVDCFDKCYSGKRQMVVLDKSDCLTSDEEHWVMWDIAGMTVSLKKNIYDPEFRKGHRTVDGDNCWGGKTVLDGCDETDLKCSNDVSWLAEVAKAAPSYGKVKDNLTPGEGGVLALFDHVNGDLFSIGVPDRVWHWTGVTEDGTACKLPEPIKYEQAFTSRAIIKNIRSKSMTMTSSGDVIKVSFKGDTRALVTNFPPPSVPPVPEDYCDSVGDKRFGCVAHHFNMYYALLDDAPECRPVPATEAVLDSTGEGKICKVLDYGGIDDPFCAPGILRRK